MQRFPTIRNIIGQIARLDYWHTTSTRVKVLLLVGAMSMVSVFFVLDMYEKVDSDFETSKKLIIMRKIAHDILVYSGDSTSRILPAQRISPHEFVIPFESRFAFLPDSVVSIVNTLFSQNNLPKNYIVNVIEQNTQQVVFGYAMLADEQKNIVPCGKRLQATQQYAINIKFQPQETSANRMMLLGGILLLLGGGVSLVLRGRASDANGSTSITEAMHTKTMHPAYTPSYVAIGKYLFYPTEQMLEFDDEKTTLTAKEAKILSIFSSQMNQLIDRERLQKEIWEDEGVIVGRSLDMFISKLRKRLGKDENVKLINIHGKGYKLEHSAN